MAYIKKAPIIEFITKGLNNPDKTKAYGYDAIEILTEIEYTPTADVVEVVRCKDCKHWQKYNNTAGAGNCMYKEFAFNYANEHTFNPITLPTHYCGYGERRTDNDSL